MSLLDKELLFTRESDTNLPSMITYCEELDKDIIKVLREIKHQDIYRLNIPFDLNMNRKYVELILHILADYGLTEYGTSPYGSWISTKGVKYLEFIDEYSKNEGN